jgi:hypothetical protein
MQIEELSFRDWAGAEFRDDPDCHALPSAGCWMALSGAGGCDALTCLSRLLRAARAEIEAQPWRRK